MADALPSTAVHGSELLFEYIIVERGIGLDTVEDLLDGLRVDLAMAWFGPESALLEPVDFGLLDPLALEEYRAHRILGDGLGLNRQRRMIELYTCASLNRVILSALGIKAPNHGLVLELMPPPTSAGRAHQRLRKA
jgi:hypothetical protein